ncbi:acyltransferase family protein [Hymenobacter humi]|uniref:Acyltransferase family protein n=1 Tax=Hymenobacter humi TaxID=1411620 RepID=A0ABW2U9W1_9BACT
MCSAVFSSPSATRTASSPAWAWARTYLQNRVARIYPMYLLLTVVTFALIQYVGSPWTWYDYQQQWDSLIARDKLFALFANLTLTRAYFDRLQFMGVYTAWSLTVEETFYLCAPLILLTVRQRAWRLVPWVVGLLGLGVLLVKLLPAYRYMGFMAGGQHLFAFTFFGRASEFAAGMALAIWLRRHPAARVGPWLTVAGVAGLLAFQLFYSLNLWDKKTNWPVDTAWHLPYSLPVAVLFAGLVLERTWLRRLLETKLFDQLGKSSYIFYLIHVGIIDQGFRAYLSGNVWVRLLGYILVSFALYKLVEHPLFNLLRSRRAVSSIPAAKPVAAAS